MKDIIVAFVFGMLFGWACTYSYMNFGECNAKGGAYIYGQCLKAEKL